MKKPLILDCTLRDGGYINRWRFGRNVIQDIIAKLGQADVDIIECGFLRDVPYDEEVSVFSCVSQIATLIAPKRENTLYVAMIAVGDILPEKILPFDGTSIDGIRLTFHKHEWEETRTAALELMAKGYKVFVQPVGTTSYSDAELLHLMEDVNILHPYAFYLVDTLGIMYRHDLLRMFYLIDNNLEHDIRVGFHSHNNLQLSFANAQELLRMDSKREIILDASVYGMGRGVGNLATELLAEYINKNIDQRYRLIPLLSIADQHLMSIYAEQRWGYDLPYFLSAVEKCHPNYAAHLLKKETLNIEDISKILSLLPAEKRDLYHPELIEELYLSMQRCQVDDSELLNRLRAEISGRVVLIMGPGATMKTHGDSIERYIVEQRPYVVSINFFTESLPTDMIFISNRKRIKTLREHSDLISRVIATSNLRQDATQLKQFVNYANYLGEGQAADNAGAMLIRVLKQAEVSYIALAGFDGFDTDLKNNYCIDSYKRQLEYKDAIRKNEEIARQIRLALGDTPYTFITPTRYSI